MKNPFEVMWKDRMDIYRWAEVKVDGITKNRQELVHSNIRCQYSKGSLADAGEGVPTLVNSNKLFCNLETDLQEGDRVVVTQRNGKKVTLSVGEGFPYTRHMEFSVKRDDTA